jgi:Phage integrase family
MEDEWATCSAFLRLLSGPRRPAKKARPNRGRGEPGELGLVGGPPGRRASRGVSSHVFMTERDGPMTPKAFHALFGRIGAWAGMPFPIHPTMLRHGCGYALANAGHDTRALQAYLGHKNIQHTPGAGSVQGVLERLTLTGAVHMRYLPEDAAQLRVCLEGQPDDRKVEADPDTGINAKTVKDLRALETWPPGLVVDTPRENYPELTVRIRSKPPPL